MEQRAAIMFCVKLKKTTTETFEMFKSMYDEKCLSRTSVFEHIKGSKKDKNRYKTLNGKAALQLPEQKNQRTSFNSVWLKIGLLSVWMLDEMTGINRETVHKILVEDLKKEKVCACFVPHLLM
jgi:hypothetical protein